MARLLLEAMRESSFVMTHNRSSCGQQAPDPTSPRPTFPYCQHGGGRGGGTLRSCSCYFPASSSTLPTAFTASPGTYPSTKLDVAAVKSRVRKSSRKEQVRYVTCGVTVFLLNCIHACRWVMQSLTAIVPTLSCW